MNALRLLKRAWQALPLSDHNRWRLTILLLEPILPFIKGSVVYTAYVREKEWQRRRIRPFHGQPFPTLPHQDKPDIFFWAVIDWRFRIQRPQHLAQGLAEAGHRVFYISTAFVNTRKAGFELEKMDAEGRIFSVRFHLLGRPAIYSDLPSPADAKRLRDSTAELLKWTRSRAVISIAEHPYWFELAKSLPDSRLLYDCLDLHEGFDNTGQAIAVEERVLLRTAELVVTTAQALHDQAAAHNDSVALIRNAAEYALFSRVPTTVHRDPDGRRILGYYGAIAHWMDMDLLDKIANHFPHCTLLLVGANECGARQRLAGHANVVFTGEVQYETLPHYLYSMDVCLLPFLVTPLTLATNPVKIYEYLAAGKPVVATDLPEMAQFGELVRTAGNHSEFLAQIEATLNTASTEKQATARQAFASENTWRHRVEALTAAMAAIRTPKISVIVVTYNNLHLTRACLDSLTHDSDYELLEVIVVDNASDDCTPDFLSEWAQAADHRQLILNRENRGFAAANNQGLSLANGDYLVLLNNDTVVTPGWARTLMNHLRCAPDLGLIGPVTNNIGNEARIRIRYRNMDEMRSKSRDHTLRHMGQSFPITNLAFFCVMMPRNVYELVGPLDEAYGLGFFEDDDYCRRVEQAGWRLACAEDVFIHHHLSASFARLGSARQALLDRNRKIYESKWGPWTPHKYRKHP
jgi:GT2 family glycosyltransferase/glycosyltransferase involved in cell wall biosynthesis